MEIVHENARYRIDFLYCREIDRVITENGIITKSTIEEIWGRQALGPWANQAKIIVYCNVSKNETKDNTQWKGVITGFSIKNPIDNFDKALLQKLALTSALSNAKFSKELRTEIWRKFAETHRSGRDICGPFVKRHTNERKPKQVQIDSVMAH